MSERSDLMKASDDQRPRVLKAEATSILASQALRPAFLIREIAWSISWYRKENSSGGMRLLMLGRGEEWGDERSMMRRFFLENFLVAAPMGLTRNELNGGTENGPIMNSESISFLMTASTVLGSARADWRLGQIRLREGGVAMPGLKPCERPCNK